MEGVEIDFPVTMVLEDSSERGLESREVSEAFLFTDRAPVCFPHKFFQCRISSRQTRQLLKIRVDEARLGLTVAHELVVKRCGLRRRRDKREETKEAAVEQRVGQRDRDVGEEVGASRDRDRLNQIPQLRL